MMGKSLPTQLPNTVGNRYCIPVLHGRLPENVAARILPRDAVQENAWTQVDSDGGST